MAESVRASNAGIRGWGLIFVGGLLFIIGVGSGSRPLQAIGFWAVVIGLGFVAYGWWVRRRAG